MRRSRFRDLVWSPTFVGTGDTFAGTAVREYIRTEMIKRGFGSRPPRLSEYAARNRAEKDRFAIVRVDGFIPPGVREHTRFDLYVSSPFDGNNTSSLSHGDFVSHRSEGQRRQSPVRRIRDRHLGERRGRHFCQSRVRTFNQRHRARSKGESSPRRGPRRRNFDDGSAAYFAIRQPQLSMSPAVWTCRYNQRFQAITDKPTKDILSGSIVAEAQDEALIQLFVPGVTTVIGNISRRS